MLSRHPSGTRLPHTDTSCANTNITAATQITHTDTSSANTNITAATQITRIDTSFANTNITAATQITPTDTSSANTNITAATQITPTDTSSAKTNVPAATQITHTDTSSADTNITAATQITPTDTFSANTNITAATQITLTDTSSANTNITAATQITRIDTSSADTNITATTQITPTDTSSANTNITAATRLNSTQFLDPSRRTRHCGEPYGTTANGCGRLRPKTQNLANTASPPDPQVKREPSLRIREKTSFQISRCLLFDMVSLIHQILFFRYTKWIILGCIFSMSKKIHIHRHPPHLLQRSPLQRGGAATRVQAVPSSTSALQIWFERPVVGPPIFGRSKKIYEGIVIGGIPCCTMLCHVMPCYTMSCHVIPPLIDTAP